MRTLTAALLLITILHGHTQTMPQPRNSAMMAYHSGLKEVLVYGGSSHSRSSTTLRDSVLWSWNGLRWKKVSVAPSLRTDAALAYDPKTKQVLLHGGSFDYSRDKGFQYTDTWAFNGSTWARLNSDFPDGHFHHSAAAFNPSENAMILFGGYNAVRESLSSDTWILTKSGWKKMDVSGNIPPARNLHSFFYDEHSQSAYILGGDYLQPQTLRDLWRLKDRKWSRVTDSVPFEFANPQGAVAVANGDLIAFASNYHTGQSETWLWSQAKNQWTRIDTTNPSPRNHASLCYDPVRKCVVLFGGEIGIESLNEVWELSMATLKWKQIKY